MSLEIEIGGKVRGFKFTMYAQDIFEEKVSLIGIPRPSRNKLQYAVCWAGLCGYLDAKEEEIDFTYEDVQEWVDKMKFEGRKEDFDKINTAFDESESFKFRIREIEDWANKVRTLSIDESKLPKKKATSTTENLTPTNLPSVV